MEDAADIEPATAMTSATDAKPVARRAKAGAQQSELPTFEELSHYFHLPTKKACEELGVGLVVLKRACRRFGLLRWPYRRPRTAVQEHSPDGSSGTDAEANQEGPSSATAVAAAAARGTAQQQLSNTATPEVFKPVPTREARALLQAACTALSQQQQQQQQPHLQPMLAAQSPRGSCQVGNRAGGAVGGQQGYAWQSPLTAEVLGMGLQPPAALAQQAQRGQAAFALQDIVSAAAAAGLCGSREPFAGLPQLESVFRQLPSVPLQQQQQQQQNYSSGRPYSHQHPAMPPQLTWPLASLQYQQHQLRQLQQQQQAMAPPRTLLDAPSLPPPHSQQQQLLHPKHQQQPFSVAHQQMHQHEQQQLAHSMAASLPSPRSPPGQAAALPPSLLDQQVLMQLATQLVEVPGLAGQLAAAMAVVLQEKCSAAVSSGNAGSGSAVTGAGPLVWPAADVCAFCRLGPEPSLGPLLDFEDPSTGALALAAHQACAHWAPRVFQPEASSAGAAAQHGYAGVLEEARRAARLKCKECGHKGAAIGCRVETCLSTFHLPCLLNQKGTRYDYATWAVYCPSHAHMAPASAQLATPRAPLPAAAEEPAAAHAPAAPETVIQAAPAGPAQLGRAGSMPAQQAKHGAAADVAPLPKAAVEGEVRLPATVADLKGRCGWKTHVTTARGSPGKSGPRKRKAAGAAGIACAAWAGGGAAAQHSSRVQGARGSGRHLWQTGGSEAAMLPQVSLPLATVAATIGASDGKAPPAVVRPGQGASEVRVAVAAIPRSPAAATPAAQLDTPLLPPKLTSGHHGMASQQVDTPMAPPDMRAATGQATASPMAATSTVPVPPSNSPVLCLPPSAGPWAAVSTRRAPPVGADLMREALLAAEGTPSDTSGRGDPLAAFATAGAAPLGQGVDAAAPAGAIGGAAVAHGVEATVAAIAAVVTVAQVAAAEAGQAVQSPTLLVEEQQPMHKQDTEQGQPQQQPRELQKQQQGEQEKPGDQAVQQQLPQGKDGRFVAGHRSMHVPRVCKARRLQQAGEGGQREAKQRCLQSRLPLRGNEQRGQQQQPQPGASDGDGPATAIPRRHTGRLCRPSARLLRSWASKAVNHSQPIPPGPRSTTSPPPLKVSAAGEAAPAQGKRGRGEVASLFGDCGLGGSGLGEPGAKKLRSMQQDVCGPPHAGLEPQQPTSDRRGPPMSCQQAAVEHNASAPAPKPHDNSPACCAELAAAAAAGTPRNVVPTVPAPPSEGGPTCQHVVAAAAVNLRKDGHHEDPVEPHAAAAAAAVARGAGSVKQAVCPMEPMTICEYVQWCRQGGAEALPYVHMAQRGSYSPCGKLAAGLNEPAQPSGNTLPQTLIAAGGAKAALDVEGDGGRGAMDWAEPLALAQLHPEADIEQAGGLPRGRPLQGSPQQQQQQQLQQHSQEPGLHAYSGNCQRLKQTSLQVPADARRQAALQPHHMAGLGAPAVPAGAAERAAAAAVTAAAASVAVGRAAAAAECAAARAGDPDLGTLSHRLAEKQCITQLDLPVASMGPGSGVGGPGCEFRVVLSRLYAKREVIVGLQPTPEAASMAKGMLEHNNAFCAARRTVVRQLPEFARGALHEILLHRGDSRILAEATQMLKAAGVQQDLAVQYKQVSRAWEMVAEWPWWQLRAELFGDHRPRKCQACGKPAALEAAPGGAHAQASLMVPTAAAAAEGAGTAPSALAQGSVTSVACEECGRAYHVGCLGHEQLQMMAGMWYCPACQPLLLQLPPAPPRQELPTKTQGPMDRPLQPQKEQQQPPRQQQQQEQLRVCQPTSECRLAQAAGVADPVTPAVPQSAAPCRAPPAEASPAFIKEEPGEQATLGWPQQGQQRRRQQQQSQPGVRLPHARLPGSGSQLQSMDQQRAQGKPDLPKLQTMIPQSGPQLPPSQGERAWHLTWQEEPQELGQQEQQQHVGHGQHGASQPEQLSLAAACQHQLACELVKAILRTCQEKLSPVELQSSGLQLLSHQPPEERRSASQQPPMPAAQPPLAQQQQQQQGEQLLPLAPGKPLVVVHPVAQVPLKVEGGGATLVPCSTGAAPAAAPGLPEQVVELVRRGFKCGPAEQAVFGYLIDQGLAEPSDLNFVSYGDMLATLGSQGVTKMRLNRFKALLRNEGFQPQD
ncbi:hypothetical protein N2152v2_004022 [Parachlorella kessleri]